MQYDVATPTEYLDALDADWRKEKLLEIRSLIQEKGTQLEEAIQYKMLSYTEAGHPVFHLNAQKSYVGLYVGTINKIDPDRQLLAGLDMGKGCIRIKKKNAVLGTGLETFIEQALAMAREGQDMDC
ncbi:MAG TPA: DUF1801 domain-containing protein [Cytophagales bacterium]|nr:DUF1801 domain-containing protein [Cytophagales bacterium]HAA21769.1 DUF1801 domain-containing protein [Cytophagales bacterium]HAP60071.1 DUF1801 domain-containing protein [Cytophagales bacterium]